MPTTRPLWRELALLPPLVAALWAASWIGVRFVPDGGGPSLWWPPAAVLVLYLVRQQPLPRTLPIALVARFTAGILVSGWPADLVTSLVGSVAVIGSYGVGVALFKRVQRSSMPGDAREMAGFLFLTGVLAPVLAALTSRGIQVLTGGHEVERFWSAVGSFALGDTAAVVAFVPMVVTLVRGRHREVTARAWRETAVFAFVLLVTTLTSSLWSTVGVATSVLAFVPLALASFRVGRAPTTFLTALTGATVAWGVAGASVDLVAVQLPFVLFALVSQLIASLLNAGGVWHDDEVEVLASLDVALPPRDSARRTAVRQARLARNVGAVITVVQLARVASGAVDLPAALPPVLLAMVGLGGLVLTNAWSVHLDVTRGFTTRRVVAETRVDAFALTAIALTFGPVFGDGLLLIAPFFAVGAAMRVPTREAAVLTAGLATVTGVVGVAGWLPWGVGMDGMTVTEAAAIGAAAVAIAVAVSRSFEAVARLGEGVREVAIELDQAQQELAASKAELTREHAKTERRATKLASQTELLRSTNRDLEQSRASLERFAGVVAHDLRSPIATAQGVINTLETLGDRMNEEQQMQLLGMLGPNLSRAARLIERLHDHARASTSTLQKEPTDLNRLVRGVLDDLSGGITAAGARVGQSSLLPRVTIDGVLIGQVLTNLLGNAIRYAGRDEDGQERVATIVIGGHWTDDGYVVTVDDDGPGLPTGSSDRLFEAGEHGGSDRRGIGLGLATCREVVERHHGRIWARPSTLGGAGFSFLIPARVPDLKHILVVEDDVAMRVLYREALEADALPGQRVVVSEAGDLATAREFLAHGGDKTFDALILDLNLPDGSGDELLDEPISAHIPVHVVSSELPDSPGMVRAAARGAVVSARDELVANPDGLGRRLLGEVV